MSASDVDVMFPLDLDDGGGGGDSGEGNGIASVLGHECHYSDDDDVSVPDDWN